MLGKTSQFAAADEEVYQTLRIQQQNGHYNFQTAATRNQGQRFFEEKFAHFDVQRIAENENAKVKHYGFLFNTR